MEPFKGPHPGPTFMRGVVVLKPQWEADESFPGCWFEIHDGSLVIRQDRADAAVYAAFAPGSWSSARMSDVQI